jgi:hypothetical protein
MPRRTRWARCGQETNKLRTVDRTRAGIKFDTPSFKASTARRGGQLGAMRMKTEKLSRIDATLDGHTAALASATPATFMGAHQSEFDSSQGETL